MKCEICHNAEAQTVLRRTVNGKDQELYVCQSCAEADDVASGGESVVKIGPISLSIENPEKLTDQLFGEILKSAVKPLIDPDNPVSAEIRPICPVCGMSFLTFRNSERLGCPHCYKAFRRELTPLIRDMHLGAVHAGKHPPCGVDSKPHVSSKETGDAT